MPIAQRRCEVVTQSDLPLPQQLQLRPQRLPDVDRRVQQALQIRWRRWMTQRLVDRWLDGRSYYLMSLGVGGADNPDQRIAEDIALFVDDTLTLGLGLLKAVMSLIAFIVLLWSPSETVTIFGATVRRQNIWRNGRGDLTECRPRCWVDVKRRVCGVASAGVRWSVV